MYTEQNVSKNVCYMNLKRIHSFAEFVIYILFSLNYTFQKSEYVLKFFFYLIVTRTEFQFS